MVNGSHAKATMKEKLLAATGALLSAPLLYSDLPGQTWFTVVARGEERSTQFVGQTASGMSTRYVIRELEPSARKILDGEYVAVEWE